MRSLLSQQALCSMTHADPLFFSYALPQVTWESSASQAFCERWYTVVLRGGLRASLTNAAAMF